jgi:homogentisate 1,2-dioxygenase
MVDTFRPLDLCDAALACEDSGYAWTWAGRTAPAAQADPAAGGQGVDPATG